MTNHQPRDVPINPEEFEAFKQQCQREGIKWTEELINLRHRLPYAEGCLTARAWLEQPSQSDLLNSRPRYEPTESNGHYSERRRKETWSEFYAAIDAVLKDLKLYEPVRKMNNHKIDFTAFCELIYPAYVRLRELGYNCYPDLTA